MSRVFVAGGVVAGVVLILLGAAAIVAGVSGKSEVRDRVADEQIVGTPDMTPEEIDLEGAGVTEAPDCSVAGEEIDTGSKAQCFADYLRIHALQSTGGEVFAELPRAVDAETGEPVPPEEASAALEDETAVANPQRDLWVTATALSTALNTSYFAEQVALFSIAMGIALILIGIGLLVLTYGALRPQVVPREQT